MQVVDPSPHVSEAEVADYLASVRNAMAGLDADATRTVALACMGTFPPGCPEDFYLRCCREASAALPPGAQLLVLVDGYANVGALLASGLATVLKFNFFELQQLCRVSTGSATVAAWLHEEPAAAALAFGHLLQLGLRHLIITDGPHPVVYCTRATQLAGSDAPPAGPALRVVTITLPRDQVQVVNAIGCGDVTAAGVLHGLAAGLDPVVALQRALALACAAAETEHPAVFELARARALEDHMCATEVTLP